MKRILAIAAAGLALAGPLVSFGAEGAVNASCEGVGNGIIIAAKDPVNGREAYKPGTCDNEHDYNGQYLDTKKDNSDIFIKYKQNGSWKQTASNGSLDNWAGYSYTDSNGSSPSQICDTLGHCSYEFENYGF